MASLSLIIPDNERIHWQRWLATLPPAAQQHLPLLTTPHLNLTAAQAEMLLKQVTLEDTPAYQTAPCPPHLAPPPLNRLLMPLAVALATQEQPRTGQRPGLNAMRDLPLWCYFPLDSCQRIVHLRTREVKLTLLQMMYVETLLQQPEGTLVSREAIRNNAYGQHDVDPMTMNVHLCYLRKALTPELTFTTKPKQGYVVSVNEDYYTLITRPAPLAT